MGMLSLCAICLTSSEKLSGAHSTPTIGFYTQRASVVMWGVLTSKCTPGYLGMESSLIWVAACAYDFVDVLQML
eukprot:m.290911 g.290911  ORF g.290911 m.290911 type:complete len:74 (-) comp15822_c0_seq2:18-239(-)